MADYKASNISGLSWVRCRAVTINNPLAGDVDPLGGSSEPVAYFQEEKVVSIDGTHVRLDAGSCRKVFDNEATIALINPETGEPTGATVTHGELYVILFSLYMQTALERDAA